MPVDRQPARSAQAEQDAVLTFYNKLSDRWGIIPVMAGENVEPGPTTAIGQSDHEAAEDADSDAEAALNSSSGLSDVSN
jgi:hypothetical protein